MLSHGDFHWDNLLMDNEGRIIICDWQGVEVGAASGDLSFFFGRLRGDGIQLKEQEIVEAYGREIRRLSGKRVTWEEIDGHTRAANVGVLLYVQYTTIRTEFQVLSSGS